MARHPPVVATRPIGYQRFDARYVYVDVLPLDNYSDEDIREAVKNCPRHCITLE